MREGGCGSGEQRDDHHAEERAERGRQKGIGKRLGRAALLATEDGSPGMLNRMDVVEPPNSAPQYMLASRMIAETGSIVKVSGMSSVTPLGAPRPGSTPTRMPNRTPTTISIR